MPPPEQLERRGESLHRLVRVVLLLGSTVFALSLLYSLNCMGLSAKVFALSVSDLPSLSEFIFGSYQKWMIIVIAWQLGNVVLMLKLKEEE